MFCAYGLAVQLWYNLGLFGAQKFSYFLHYMRQGRIINADSVVHLAIDCSIMTSKSAFIVHLPILISTRGRASCSI